MLKCFVCFLEKGVYSCHKALFTLSILTSSNACQHTTRQQYSTILLSSGETQTALNDSYTI